MKLHKLKITGNSEAFIIQYTASTNFVQYEDCEFEGSEQEKFEKFIVDLQRHGGSQPVNVKVKMTDKAIDRALSKSAILNCKNVEEFVKIIGK